MISSRNFWRLRLNTNFLCSIWNLNIHQLVPSNFINFFSPQPQITSLCSSEVGPLLPTIHSSHSCLWPLLHTRVCPTLDITLLSKPWSNIFLWQHLTCFTFYCFPTFWIFSLLKCSLFYLMFSFFEVGFMPKMGLELMTLRSRAACFSDWGRQALQLQFILNKHAE